MASCVVLRSIYPCGIAQSELECGVFLRLSLCHLQTQDGGSPTPCPVRVPSPLPPFARFFPGIFLPTGETLLLPSRLPPPPRRKSSPKQPKQTPSPRPSRRAYLSPSPRPLPELRMLPAQLTRRRCLRPPMPTRRRLPSPPEPSPPLTLLPPPPLVLPPPRVSRSTSPRPRRTRRLLPTATATAALALRPKGGWGRRSWRRCVFVAKAGGFRASGVRFSFFASNADF